MIHWEDSRSTQRRHVHTPVKDFRGNNVCTTCWQVVVVPILSSDDPRLQGAGLMRSGHHEIDEPGRSMTLPELLITLYNEVSFPIAPYIIEVLNEQHDRGYLPDDFWIQLARKVAQD